MRNFHYHAQKLYPTLNKTSRFTSWWDLPRFCMNGNITLTEVFTFSVSWLDKPGEKNTVVPPESLILSEFLWSFSANCKTTPAYLIGCNITLCKTLLCNIFWRFFGKICLASLATKKVCFFFIRWLGRIFRYCDIDTTHICKIFADRVFCNLLPILSQSLRPCTCTSNHWKYQ